MFKKQSPLSPEGLRRLGLSTYKRFNGGQGGPFSIAGVAGGGLETPYNRSGDRGLRRM
jgi:hypothetical protein